MSVPDKVLAFPLPRVHTGVHLGNGRLGVLVWGSDTVRLTFARNGFWDRRGAKSEPALTYHEIRSLLEEGREAEVRAAFTQPSEMRQIGGGTLILDLGEPVQHATWHRADGSVTLVAASGRAVRVELAMTNDVLVIRGVTLREARLAPAWEGCGEALARIGFAPPEATPSGFIQRTPADECLRADLLPVDDALVLRVTLGDREPSAPDLDGLRVAREADWAEFWARFPDLPGEEPILGDRHLDALAKLHSLCHPDGVAATLQGPWMEDHRLPLWSNDYHFNINLQMIYQPCLDLGLWDHLMPLWRRLHAWLPDLRRRGERFFGVGGAVMLPHAVDDQGRPIGSYWQGTIDHASTAWMATMAWQAACASGDEWLREELALPLLHGAFEGFWAMMEPDGDGLCLPISVSPEYGEGAPGTWGKNSSFALAAVHRVVRDLLASTGAPDPRWLEVQRRLPRFSSIPSPVGPYDNPHEVRLQIALWEGQRLDMAHRHHSHLAGLYPFDSLLPEDEPVLRESLRHWAGLGGGQWCAWGTVWAICLMARAGWTDGAKAWLAFLIRAAENEGGHLSAGGALGTFISWGSADVARRHAHEGDHEVMQLDANIGLLSVWHELFRAKHGHR